MIEFCFRGWHPRMLAGAVFIVEKSICSCTLVARMKKILPRQNIFVDCKIFYVLLELCFLQYE